MKYRSYQDESIWKEVILLFPEDNRPKDQHMPAEKYMEWRGNFIHIDHYSNPLSRLKVIPAWRGG